MFLSLQEADGQKKYKCLVKKMKTTKNHIEDPEGYAEFLYVKIKGNCS